MATFTRHAAVAAGRNGTVDHTVGPDGTGGSVVAGSAFTPTAGRFLAVFVDAAVTSTTPSGWTLPTNGSTINNTGLYVWHRTAAGGDTFTTTHNAGNFPAIFDFYEFEAGTTFNSAAAQNSVTNGTAGPTLSSLTGSNWTAGVVGQGENSAVSGHTVTWDAGTEATDTATPASGTDGYTYSLTYTADNVAASATYTATGTDTRSQERLVVAIVAAAGAAPPPGILIELTKVV